MNRNMENGTSDDIDSAGERGGFVALAVLAAAAGAGAAFSLAPEKGAETRQRVGRGLRSLGGEAAEHRGPAAAGNSETQESIAAGEADLCGGRIAGRCRCRRLAHPRERGAQVRAAGSAARSAGSRWAPSIASSRLRQREAEASRSSAAIRNSVLEPELRLAGERRDGSSRPASPAPFGPLPAPRSSCRPRRCRGPKAGRRPGLDNAPRFGCPVPSSPAAARTALPFPFARTIRCSPI